MWLFHGFLLSSHARLYVVGTGTIFWIGLMILESIQLLFGNYALHLVLVSKPNCFLLELYLVQWILVLCSLEFCLLGMLQEKTNNYMRGFF